MATLGPKPVLKAAKSSPQITKKKSPKKKGAKSKSDKRGRGRKNKYGLTAITVSTFGSKSKKKKKYDYKVSDYVRLTDMRQGYIRYVGQTAFCEQILYGIELDDEFTGKHSGMFKGVKYFDCARPNTGVFVRLNRIASPLGAISGNTSTKSSHNLGLGSANRSKHGRKLSSMIYRGVSQPKKMSNVSRVSFVVPDMSALLLSPVTTDDEGNDTDDEFLDDNNKPFDSLIRAYSSGMRDSMVIHEENEEKYEGPKEEKNKLRLTPLGGKVSISSALENKMKRIYKKKKKTVDAMIGVRIPFGALNSKCMSVILSFLTMKELSEYSFVSLSARDSIRLVPLYDFRYMLYDALCVQDIRSILCILKFHKPKELILPMAYFIYDPVVLRLFLQFFNVLDTGDSDTGNHHMFKYIHKLVIDDRDIRPASWLMRPGNYPWNELCNRETSDLQDTTFPFELVECFQSLGANLWELDIRYTMNVELSFFLRSVSSILYLSVSAENRMDIEQFYNVTHLTIQNRRVTWEEIERTELLDWKHSFTHLTHLVIINQRFEASCIDLLSAITWLPCIKSYFQSNCHFNEPTVAEAIQHYKEKSNTANRVHEFTIKRHNLSKTLFTVLSQLFGRINTLRILDCKLRKIFDFEFFKWMTHLTHIDIVNLKPKKRKKGTSYVYAQWLQDIYNKITKYVYVCPVTIECNLIASKIMICSHLECKYCKQLIEKKRMNDHLRLMCSERSVECTLCGGKVKRKSMTYHWANNCKQYYIQCALCPKYFTVETRHDFHDHVLRHSMDLDQEAGKYEMVFVGNAQATALTNKYPVYTITCCKQCQCRAIGPVVMPKYRKKLIPNQCESCNEWYKPDITINNDNNNIPKSKRISVMKKERGKKVLIHPYPKNIKLKPINAASTKK